MSNELSEKVWNRQVVSYSDPRSIFLQQELGLTARQIVNKAKRLGLRMRKVYGRLWVATEDVPRLKE